MLKADVIIVGGGPAGSACAWRLMEKHVDCLVLDQVPFPRFKPCAGWITPDVVKDLALNIADYPGSFTTFKKFYISVWGLQFKLRTTQHAIRRFEFDDWLLRRSGAPFVVHTVRSIVPEKEGYSLDGEFSARYLVGAGGTYCPVYRTLFKTSAPKTKTTLIAAQEEEFPYAFDDPNCRLWFFDHHLPGYSWYVPKSNGFINVGVGGMAEQLNGRGDNLKHHWARLVEKLDRMGLVRGHTYKPSAHTYYVRQRQPELRRGNAFVIGDAAGLASLDMGEGIGPAIRSGLLAADAILKDANYCIDSIGRYSFSSIIKTGWSH